MPQNGEPLIFGELESFEDGVAHGWVQPGQCGPSLVIIRLDGVPAGAAASIAGDEGSAPETTRRTFQVELDASRIALGGLLTAEQVSGTIRAKLAGHIRLAAKNADFLSLSFPENGIGPFRKCAGLRVEGWIAAKDRNPAPVLSGLIGGRVVLTSGPSAFSPDAWKAGGQLASGYNITFPLAKKAKQAIEAMLRDDVGDMEVWRGVFDASDMLHEDIRQITACGACRRGNRSPDVLKNRCEAFIREIETAQDARVNAETAGLALRLISWMRDMRDPETAFATAGRLRPPVLMRLLPGPFLETMAALICALPRGMMEPAIRQLEAAFAAAPANRIVSLLIVLARTRMTGLDDGGERIIRILHVMNYSQSALNWIWEAVSDAEAVPASAADLRQLVEFEIIARNVPFMNGYELRAARPA